MLENFWLELLLIACATPLVAHGVRTEVAAKYCTQFGVPVGISYRAMVFHPRYWHLWTVRQWKTFTTTNQNR
ncbi:hypothetical protein [Burkholderia anthina]|uniref:hypothetical protein n=1 Tax=Burkholderia anthina TaxID=179879 RepID=UPI0015883B33|nr:hypothetical protein [Burkholderia anthina]